jgi:hypothetical protein
MSPEGLLWLQVHKKQAQKNPLDGGSLGASCRRQNTQCGEMMPSAVREVNWQITAYLRRYTQTCYAASFIW